MDEDDELLEKLPRVDQFNKRIEEIRYLSTFVCSD